MKGIRWETKHRVHYLKRSGIKRLLYVPLEEIPDGQKRRDIEYYLKGQTELEQVLKLVSDFKILLSGKIESVSAGLVAVKNAIKYDYSNGPAEGHNNKIKVIKRQMYGRCKFEILRQKEVLKF